MTSYNLTQIANVTDILSFTQNVNTYLVDGWLGILLLIGIGTIAFLSFHYSTKDMKKSLLATTFIIFLMSFLMRALDLVPNTVLFVTLIGCGIAVAFTWKE